MDYNSDCGWQAINRTSQGTFAWNTTRFPSGIPSLSSFVHDLGLQFGLYSDAYVFTQQSGTPQIYYI